MVGSLPSGKSVPLNTHAAAVCQRSVLRDSRSLPHTGRLAPLPPSAGSSVLENRAGTPQPKIRPKNLQNTPGAILFRVKP